MSVHLPSDIVLDVARAANPVRYQAAVNKLSAAAAGTFSQTFEAAQASASPARPTSTDVDSILTRFRSSETLVAPKHGDPAQDFEAFVLQSFIESMLPKNAASVFGKGNTGDIWKSMLAGQIGAQIAKAGGVGIARTLARSLDADAAAQRRPG